ncbi:MAG: hypothetical protein V3U63_02005 [Gemmatimonadota bacterium]
MEQAITSLPLVLSQPITARDAGFQGSDDYEYGQEQHGQEEYAKADDGEDGDDEDDEDDEDDKDDKDDEDDEDNEYFGGFGEGEDDDS